MGFSENTITTLTDSLKEVLASTYVLYLKTQNFHWNVETPHFFSYHKLFEEQYEDLAKATDLLAEQIRTFKVKSPGTMKEFLTLSFIEESEHSIPAKEMIQRLVKDHEKLSEKLREKVKESQNLEDEVTADVYIERLRAHEKTAWFLRSHLS